MRYYDKFMHRRRGQGDLYIRPAEMLGYFEILSMSERTWGKANADSVVKCNR